MKVTKISQYFAKIVFNTHLMETAGMQADERWKKRSVCGGWGVVFRLNRLFDWTAKKRHEVKAAPPPLSTGTFSSSWVLLQSHHHNITGEPKNQIGKT